MIRRITRIAIHNFQSHKDTVLDSDCPVLVLCGESNNGKSVVIRALQWLFTNRPTGDGFVSHWAKSANRKGEKVMAKDAECSVSIDFTDPSGASHSVSRVKTSAENYYVVDGVKLSAIGTDVPQEVSELLSMHDENVQDQDEKYYLLGMKAGEVASRLNELVHLDTIDQAYSFMKRRKLDAAAHLKECEAIYYDNKIKLDGLKHVPQLVQDLDEVKAMEEKLSSIGNGMADIEGLMKSLYAVDEELSAVTDVSMFSRAVERVSDMVSMHESTADEIVDIARMADRVDMVSEELASMPKVSDMDIAELDGLRTDASALHDVIEDMLATISRVTSIRLTDLPTEDIGELERLLSLLRSNEEQADGMMQMYRSVSDALEALSAKEADMARAARELPDVCPLCGAPMEGHAHA